MFKLEIEYIEPIIVLICTIYVDEISSIKINDGFDFDYIEMQ